MEATTKNIGWKQKLQSELKEYAFNVAYLAVFFSTIIFYRRLILLKYNIYLDDYFLGVIKALVIAKVIMIGAFFGISRRFENKPLIIPVLYKSLLFVVFVVVFDVIEGYLRSLMLTGDFENACQNLVAHHFGKAWLGGIVVVFIMFIPFFGIKELQRVIGKDKMVGIFFKKIPLQKNSPE